MPEARISRWYWQTLAKRLQVGSHCIEVLIVQPHGRHLRSRLDGIRIFNPEPQLLRRVGRRSRSNGVAAHDVGEVGAESSFCRRARNRMAVDARRRLKKALPG